MSTPALEPIVQTDERSRLVLRGRPNRRFLMRELPDGVIVLEPAVVVSEAQAAYDADPALRETLAEAMASPTVTRHRARR